MLKNVGTKEGRVRKEGKGGKGKYSVQIRRVDGRS